MRCSNQSFVAIIGKTTTDYGSLWARAVQLIPV